MCYVQQFDNFHFANNRYFRDELARFYNQEILALVPKIHEVCEETAKL